jgi:L-malate glycosyltransferase
LAYRPKILVIENSIDVTGALKSILRTAHDLHHELDYCFLIPQGSKGRSAIEKFGFIKIVQLPMREINRKIFSLALYLPALLINSMKLRKIIREERIDLIHVNDLYNMLPVVLAIAKSGVPYICHVRFLPDRFPKLLFGVWIKLHYKYAAKVVAVSHAVFNQCPPHCKLTVFHNELPISEKYGRGFKRALPGPFIFLYLSNIMEGKGQDFALEAFAKVAHLLPEWRLRFVGGSMGREKNECFRTNLMRRAESLKILDKIEWQGFTEDVEKEYKQAEIVLNFSESESFSITCLEAQFYGRPVIATDCGGPTEIIQDGRTGIIVRNRHVDDMKNAMIKLATDHTLRNSMGALGKDFVTKKFSFDNTSRKLRNIYATSLTDWQ